MYEFMILALLMRWPMHGYLIASVLNDMIGPYAKVSHGRLYPLLAKLQTQGLVVASATTGDRRQRSFRITEKGRERFRRLAMDTEIRQGDYQRLFWIKLAFFGLLAPEERLFLVDHYLTYCKAHIFHLTRELAEMEGPLAEHGFMTASRREGIVFAMRHAIAQWELDIEGAERWKREHPDGGGPVEPPPAPPTRPPAPR